MNRRTLLTGSLALAAANHATGAIANEEPQRVSIDDFLARSTPAERARYHSNALAETLADMHPERAWRTRIDHEHGFALVVGDLREDLA